MSNQININMYVIIFCIRCTCSSNNRAELEFIELFENYNHVLTRSDAVTQDDEGEKVTISSPGVSSVIDGVSSCFMVPGGAWHCTAACLRPTGRGYHPRRESNSKRRVGGEGGEGRETAVWPSTKPPPTFSTPPLTSPPLPSQYLLLPPVLSLAAVFGCSMQNGLCLSALA